MMMRSRSLLLAALGFLLFIPGVRGQSSDPRSALSAGWMDPGSAARNLRLVSSTARPAGFFRADNPGDFFTANSDLAFQGDLVFVGNFAGFQIYDIADPAAPRLRTSVLCPGGQGDLSVRGTLLFMSVEMPNGRTDCGTDGPLAGGPDAGRFMGVRIFDLSNLEAPRQIAAIQTCRGSHTHTLLADPGDPDHLYVYVQGTSPVRSSRELPGCSGARPEEDPNTALFRIEIIQVPLSDPASARIVNAPRIFADAQTGAIDGLWGGGTHGPGTQETALTDQCHDITTYPELGLAAGACSGNGILLDLSDPANPVRIAEVTDPNFAYWHSATFNNDGSTVLFTDEWGGGVAARCRDTDPPTWGANALFRREGAALVFAGYYKLPAAQAGSENCVAHNGSLIPVPGRDIKVQAWYQGGISIFDFSDPANPFEIAYFDRGPVDASQLMLGGQWSTYWYNGRIYGSEIARGLDVLELLPSEHLSANEIAAASLIRLDEFNPQMQPRIEWPAHFVVAAAYLDQLERSPDLDRAAIAALRSAIEAAERTPAGAGRSAELGRIAGMARRLADAADGLDSRRLGLLAETLDRLAAGD